MNLNQRASVTTDLEETERSDLLYRGPELNPLMPGAIQQDGNKSILSFPLLSLVYLKLNQTNLSINKLIF